MTVPPRNVVFLSQRVPHPPDRGDRISTHHILRHLREQGCRVRVGCLSEDERDERAIDELRGMVDELCAPRILPRVRKLTCLRGLLTGEPLTLPFFRHPVLRREVDRWLSQDPPDVVFLYSSSMAQYVLEHRGVPRVMHFAELDSDKWRQYAATSGPAGRLIYGREAKRLLRYETRIAHEFDASLVISEVERELFERLIPGVRPRR
jgi:glycosyltransferase involved in cell wall biosynthesis